MPDDQFLTQRTPFDPITEIVLSQIEQGWRVEYISDSVRQFGYSPQSLTGGEVTLLQLFHPADQYAFQKAITKEHEYPQEYKTDYRVVTASGEMRWIFLCIAPIPFSEDTGVRKRIMLVNITRHKRAEEILKEIFLNLDGTIPHLADGIWDLDLHNEMVKFSGRLFKKFGYISHSSEPVEDRWENLVYPDDVQRTRRAFKDYMEGSAPRFQLELRIRTKDDSWSWVQARGIVSEWDDSFRPLRVVGTVIDIHDQKTTGQAFVDGDDSKYRSLFLNMNYGFAHYRFTTINPGDFRDFEILEVNSAFERIFEFEAHSVLGKPLSQVFHRMHLIPDDLRFIDHSIPALGESLAFERYFEQIGKWIQGYVFSTNEGFFSTIIKDVTEQKLLELRLRESEQRYRTIFEEARDTVFVLAVSGKILDANQAATRMLGYTVEELKRIIIHEINPKSELSTLSEHTDAILSDGQVIFDSVLLAKDGTPVSVEINSTLIPFGDQKAALCIARDIRERKRYEQGLLKSHSELEKRVRERTAELRILNQNLQKEILERKKTKRELLLSEELLPQLPDAVIVTDLQGNVIRWMGNAEQIFGYTANEIIGKPISITYHPSIADHMLEDIHEALKQTGTFSGEIPSVKKDGTEILLIKTVRPVFDEYGNHILNISNNHDITARKRIEEKLLTSESQYRELVQSQRDFVVRINRQGKLTFVNDIYCAKFKKSRQDLIGKEAPPFLTGADAPPGQTADTGRQSGISIPFFVEQRIEMENGERWIAWENYPIRGAGQGITEFQCVGRDITDLKKSEEKLLIYQKRLQSLASKMSFIEERHRRRMAEMLHDGIGQSLALCKYLITALPGIRGQKRFKNTIAEIQDTIDSVIRQTRSLTFELSPPMLYELGLAKAINRLANQMLNTHPICFRLTGNTEVDTLSGDLRGMLFQSVRELLMNVIKHSRAKNVSIDIQNNENGYRIIVEDDGEGFDLTNLNTNPEKANCYGLFSISEKIHFAGGSMTIHSVPGKGTSVSLFIPPQSESTQEG